MPFDEFGLTIKQRLFCDEYLRNHFNGNKAAIFAQYPIKSCRVIATENLTKPVIRTYIERRMKEQGIIQGISLEWIYKKLKNGVDLSIPDDIADAQRVDVRAGVSCISEINKMQGNYAADKMHMDVNVKEIEKDVGDAERDY